MRPRISGTGIFECWKCVGYKVNSSNFSLLFSFDACLWKERKKRAKSDFRRCAYIYACAFTYMHETKYTHGIARNSSECAMVALLMKHVPKQKLRSQQWYQLIFLIFHFSFTFSLFFSFSVGTRFTTPIPLNPFTRTFWCVCFFFLLLWDERRKS